MAHAIGSRVWSKGDEYTITSVPFTAHGIELQSAVRDDGKTLDIPTPEYIEARTARNVGEWNSQQVQFARLHLATVTAKQLRDEGSL